MEDKIENLLSSCFKINFGMISLSEGEKEFCKELNGEIISLCQSMPESTQTEALLFFMWNFKTSFEKELNFLKYFYAPAWTTLYWLIQSASKNKKLDTLDVANAKTAHVMAMLLHALDDHLCDGDISISHLALLVRSQAWMIMNKSLDSLADGIDGGKQIAYSFINDYYASMCASQEIESLDRYCGLFRKQMATWLIVPVLMAEKFFRRDEFTGAVQSAFSSFGVAWRLLDDIKDLNTDMMSNVHSSVYVCLSTEIKKCWDKAAGKKTEQNNIYKSLILDYIIENKIIEKIRKRICSEMDSAARLADRFNLTGLADEYRCLIRPLDVEKTAL
jgi:hypothetical protein